MKAITPDLRHRDGADWGRSRKRMANGWVCRLWLTEHFVIPVTTRCLALEVSTECTADATAVWLDMPGRVEWGLSARSANRYLYSAFSDWLCDHFPILKDGKPHKFYVCVLYD